mgnify:CR=1 FL=1
MNSCAGCKRRTKWTSQCLAPVVFEAANEGDARMMEIIEEGARVLCEYTEAVASGLHLLAPKVALIGGLFHRDSIYTHAFRRRLKRTCLMLAWQSRNAHLELGAAWLASELCDHAAVHPKLSETGNRRFGCRFNRATQPRSENLEKMSGRELVQVFVEEEKFVQEALRAAAAELTRGH